VGTKQLDRFFNLDEKYLNLDSQDDTYWGNLGYWNSIHTNNLLDYASACNALACQLADTALLTKDDRVLDIGFGCGDQLLTWINHYQINDLFGINISECQTLVAKERLSNINTQLANQIDCCDVSDILQWCNSYHLSKVDKILVLDCAYHFPNKIQFLKDSYSLLDKSGNITLCDLVISEEPLSFKNKLILRLVCKLCNIPFKNLAGKTSYTHLANKIGYSETYFYNISEHVMLGFHDWLRIYKKKYGHSDKPIKWKKYVATASFLKWAYKNNIFEYQIIRLTP